MPSIKPGFLADAPVTSFGLGKSDTISRKLAFPVSPYFSGELTNEVIKKSFFQPRELVDGKLSDGGYAFGTVDRFYQGTPNLEEAPVGGGGLPASPYGPNVAAPTRGHEPSSIPAEGVEATNRIRSRSNGAWIGNSLHSPHLSTPTIVDPTQRRLGVGSGNSFRVRIA